MADDNADMRDYVRRLLNANYQVIAVADGQQALQATVQDKPDLVLTDAMMPNLDGFGLLKALRENPGTAFIPVIMLSARAGEESRVEGLEAGADDYLIKPFSARELLARVSGALALPRPAARPPACCAKVSSACASLHSLYARRAVYSRDQDGRIRLTPSRGGGFGGAEPKLQRSVKKGTLDPCTARATAGRFTDSFIARDLWR